MYPEHLPTIFWAYASAFSSFPHNGFVAFQAVIFILLFSLKRRKFKKAGRGFQTVVLEGDGIILENISATGNLHHLDLQVPKHPQNQASCFFPGC